MGLVRVGVRVGVRVRVRVRVGVGVRVRVRDCSPRLGTDAHYATHGETTGQKIPREKSRMCVHVALFAKIGKQLVRMGLGIVLGHMGASRQESHIAGHTTVVLVFLKPPMLLIKHVEELQAPWVDSVLRESFITPCRETEPTVKRIIHVTQDLHSNPSTLFGTHDLCLSSDVVKYDSSPLRVCDVRVQQFLHVMVTVACLEQGLELGHLLTFGDAVR